MARTKPRKTSCVEIVYIRIYMYYVYACMNIYTKFIICIHINIHV